MLIYKHPILIKIRAISLPHYDISKSEKGIKEIKYLVADFKSGLHSGPGCPYAPVGRAGQLPLLPILQGRRSCPHAAGISSPGPSTHITRVSSRGPLYWGDSHLRLVATWGCPPASEGGHCWTPRPSCPWDLHISGPKPRSWQEGGTHVWRRPPYVLWTLTHSAFTHHVFPQSCLDMKSMCPGDGKASVIAIGPFYLLPCPPP